MKRRDIQEFIYFITRSKHLSRAQQRKRDALLARDLYGRANHQAHASSGKANHIEEKEDSQPHRPKDNPVQEESPQRISSKVSESSSSTSSSTPSDSHRRGVKATYISPKNIQDFLRDYNQDRVLKYTCHLIDDDEIISDINKECGSDSYDFLKHKELIIKHFNSLRDKYKEEGIWLSRNIITLIQVYLTGKDLEGKGSQWSSNIINIGWSCDELSQWAEQNPGKIPNPGNNIARKQKSSGYRLPSAFLSNTTGDRILSFSQLVIFFKSQFHIRLDNSLRKILEHTNKRWSEKDVIFSFSQDQFIDEVQLLTDVDKLIQAYKKIIDLCIECRETPDNPILIELSFYDDPDDCSTFFEIHHLNQGYNKTLKDALERIGEKQAQLIIKQINGLCDLYVEAAFPGGSCARINLWDVKHMNFETLNDVTGVKYILKF